MVRANTQNPLQSGRLFKFRRVAARDRSLNGTRANLQESINTSVFLGTNPADELITFGLPDTLEQAKSLNAGTCIPILPELPSNPYFIFALLSFAVSLQSSQLFAVYNRLSKRPSSKTVETVRYRHFSASLTRAASACCTRFSASTPRISRSGTSSLFAN